MTKIVLPVFILGLCLSVNLHSQVDLTPSFNHLLQKSSLSFVTPLDAGYRSISVKKDHLVPYHFSIYSNQESMEIRYIVEPFQPNDKSFIAPQVKATSLMMSLATNDDEYVVSSFRLSPEYAQEAYHADWGCEFFFHPKEAVSYRQHCKLIALFKEGKGMAFVLMFFDDAPDTLDSRSVALQFEAEDIQE